MQPLDYFTARPGRMFGRNSVENLSSLNPKTGVILVASGYVFRCPECDAVGYRPSALERIVSCERCGSGFPIVEVCHRKNVTLPW
jgi:hypothetical protein